MIAISKRKIFVNVIIFKYLSLAKELYADIRSIFTRKHSTKKKKHVCILGTKFNSKGHYYYLH